MENNKFTAIPCSYNTPHEVVFDILTRVPVKSMLRFKCVSKQFGSLVSQPSFIEAHQSGSSLNYLLVSLPDSGDSRRTYITSNLDRQRANCFEVEYLNKPCLLKLHHLESCNGLVCLWDDGGDVAICNPFTRQHVFLPKPTNEKGFWVTCCSLGFDPTTKKHKVITTGETMSGTRCWNIFTVGIDNSWREIHGHTPFFPVTISNCVYINGVIYRFHTYGEQKDDLIAAFNVGEETFTTISSPCGLSLSRHKVSILDMKGELALVDHKTFRQDGKISMYVLSSNGSWMKKQTIELRPSELNSIAKTCWNCRFTSTRKGEIVLIPTLRRNPRRDWMFKYELLFIYDTAGKKEWSKFELRGVGEVLKFSEVYGSVWSNLAETLWPLE